MQTLEMTPGTVHFTSGTATGCGGYGYVIVSGFAKAPSSGSSEVLTASPLDIALGWSGTAEHNPCNEVVFYAAQQAGYQGSYFNSTNFPNGTPSTGPRFVQREAGVAPSRGDVLVWRGVHMNFSLGGTQNYGWRTTPQQILPGQNSWWSGRPEVWQFVNQQ